MGVNQRSYSLIKDFSGHLILHAAEKTEKQGMTAGRRHTSTYPLSMIPTDFTKWICMKQVISTASIYI